MNIAFCGKMASGKDTMGEYFQKTFQNSIHISFADALRKETQDTLDQLRIYPDYKPVGMSEHVFLALRQIALSENSNVTDRTDGIRTALQIYGTDYRREQEPDYWVNKVKEIVENNKNQLYYVTDGRFLNEINMLKDLNFFIVKLDVDEDEQEKRVEIRDGLKPTKKQKTHPSETEFEKFNDYDLIINTSEQTPDETFNIVMKGYRKKLEDEK